MPSLIPNPSHRNKHDGPDLRRVFYSDECRPTVERVARFIGRFEAEFGDRPFELLRSGSYVEEFLLVMPTAAAWRSEIDLCTAIESHADGTMSDDSLRKIIEKYFSSHIFLYKNNTRQTKEGDWWPWIDTPVYCLTTPRHQTGNIIQTLLAVEIERTRGNDGPVSYSALK